MQNTQPKVKSTKVDEEVDDYDDELQDQMNKMMKMMKIMVKSEPVKLKEL